LWEQVGLPLAMARDRIDLAHFTSSTGPLLWRGKSVVTLHDVIFMKPGFSAEGTWYQRLGAVYRRWVVPTVARQARAVITVSHYEKDQILATLPLGDSSVRVVHNGVGAPFLGGRAKGADPVDASAPHRYFLFLGNEAPKKNTRRVLAAWAHQVREDPSTPDLVVVELSRARVRQLLADIDAVHLAPRVHCPGYVSHEGLRDLYAGAMAFLYPSLVESFGLPVLEAMACGAPVITSNVTSMPEVAADAALLVDPRSESDLARAMHAVVSSAVLRDGLRKRGQERARAFSWANVAARTAAVYDEAA
jgi:glycosyltransferase involved in cell wall biosynthesis